MAPNTSQTLFYSHFVRNYMHNLKTKGCMTFYLLNDCSYRIVWLCQSGVYFIHEIRDPALIRDWRFIETDVTIIKHDKDWQCKLLRSTVNSTQVVMSVMHSSFSPKKELLAVQKSVKPAPTCFEIVFCGESFCFCLYHPQRHTKVSTTHVYNPVKNSFFEIVIICFMSCAFQPLPSSLSMFL